MTMDPLLASQDHPRYVLSLLCPRKRRADLQALFGFNLELAQIRDRVSEPLIGQMRLRFWLDALDNIMRGNPPQQPAGIALAALVAKYNLPRDPLARLIESRGAEIGGEPPGSLDGAVKEAMQRSGYLHELAARIVVTDPSHDTLGVARHAGTAWGLVGMIRSVPFDFSEGLCRLPVTLCRQQGLDMERPLDPDMKAPLRSVLRALADRATEQLQTAQGLRWQRGAAPAVLIGYAAANQLRALARSDFDFSDRRLQSLIGGNRLGPGLMVGLMWRTWLGRL